MATLVQQVNDLKKENKALKMKVTKMEKKNGAAVHNAAQVFRKEIKDLEMQLEASEERGNILADNNDALLETVDEMKDQIGHFQKLIAHTAAVTEWKVQ